MTAREEQQYASQHVFSSRKFGRSVDQKNTTINSNDFRRFLPTKVYLVSDVQSCGLPILTFTHS